MIAAGATRRDESSGAAMGFFNPPELIAHKVFATVPPQLRKQGDQRHKRFDARGGIVMQDCFLEGPAFDRQGRFHCVDMYSGRVLRVGADDKFDVIADYGGHPNGLKIHKDGRIFIADRKKGLLQLDPGTGKISLVLSEADNGKLRGLNDLVFDSKGNCFFTDFEGASLQEPNGRVFKLSPDGKLECLIDNVPGPNGIVLNGSETAIFVAATFANAVWRMPINEKGGIGKVGAFVNLSGGVGPDGLAVDSAGNLVIAHAGLGTIWVVNPLGEPLWKIKGEQGFLTNIAYGGKDDRQLFITNSDAGTILVADMPVAGKPMYSHL
jgi:gluconolactonase